MSELISGVSTTRFKSRRLHTNIVPGFGLRISSLLFISPGCRVGDIEIIAKRQQVVQKLGSIFGEIVPCDVGHCAVTDITPRKSPIALGDEQDRNSKPELHYFGQHLSSSGLVAEITAS